MNNTVAGHGTAFQRRLGQRDRLSNALSPQWNDAVANCPKSVLSSIRLRCRRCCGVARWSGTESGRPKIVFLSTEVSTEFTFFGASCKRVFSFRETAVVVRSTAGFYSEWFAVKIRYSLQFFHSRIEFRFVKGIPCSLHISAYLLLIYGICYVWLCTVVIVWKTEKLWLMLRLRISERIIFQQQPNPQPVVFFCCLFIWRVPLCLI